MSTKSKEIITYHDLLNKLFKLDRLMLWKLQFLLDSNDNNDEPSLLKNPLLSKIVSELAVAITPSREGKALDQDGLIRNPRCAGKGTDLRIDLTALWMHG